MGEQKIVPGVHPVVNERVDHRVGHGEPVEGEEEVLHVLGVRHRAVVVRVDEVGVVRQPAHREDQHDDDEHPHHLRNKKYHFLLKSHKNAKILLLFIVIP